MDSDMIDPDRLAALRRAEGARPGHDAISRRALLGVAGAAAASLSLPALAGGAGSGRNGATPASLLLPQPVPPAAPNIGAGSVSVADFGAVPDDGADDTEAIQAAIDSLAGAGGGTVWFEPGRYDVSIQAGAGVAIVVRSGIRLAARQRRATTVRLADAQGDYYAVLATFTWTGTTLPTNDPMNDIAVDGLVIDSNATANPVHETDLPFGQKSHQRAAVWFNNVERFAIEHCTLTDIFSIQVVLINTYVRDGTPGNKDGRIAHCRFELVGGSSRDYDHSSIFFWGERFEVVDNVFHSRFGAGTTGVATAIEVHGDDQTVTGNEVHGYRQGFNITGHHREQSRRQLISHNTLTGMLKGGYLWHTFFGDNTTGPALEDITITHNDLTLDAGGWVGFTPNSPRSGFNIHPLGDAPIDGLLISNNRIDFGDVSAIANDRNYTVDSWSAGITFSHLDLPDVPVRNFEITGNVIIGAVSSGIWSTMTLINGLIQGNTLTNPGTNGTFDPPKNYGSYPPYSDDFRTGVYLGGTNQNVVVGPNP